MPIAPSRLSARASITLVAAVTLAMLVNACAEAADGAVIVIRPADREAPGAAPTETPTPTPTATATPSSTPVATATATPSPVPVERASLACSEREAAAASLAGGVAETLDGYDGEWGFALLDLRCGSRVEVNAEHRQFPASAAKIVSVIAVLQAVERGDVAMEDVAGTVDLTLRVSLDDSADHLDTFLEQADFDEVLALAGVSPGSYVREGTWRRSWMTAADLALIWSAIVQGRLLGDEMTELVISLAEAADIPDDKETFPDSAFALDGYRYGQKAGYNVEDGVPYHLVGASFLVPVGGSEGGAVAVLLITSEVEDLFDEQRRSVFPLVVEYLETVEPPAP